MEEQHSIVVDKRKIDVKESIKQIGFYAINVKLHPEVVAELKVTVEPEEDKKAQPAAAPEASRQKPKLKPSKKIQLLKHLRKFRKQKLKSRQKSLW